MLNTDKELKLYYSIGEVADMFGVRNDRSYLSFGKRKRHDTSRCPATFEG